ncbi:MAG: TlpA family protein disulfide reductase [Candidatus Bipolaricaulia bacterium]
MSKRLAIGILVAVVALAAVGAALFLKLGPSTANGPGEQVQAGQYPKGGHRQNKGSAGPEKIPGGQEVELGTAVGQRAPDFSLTDLEGKEFSLSDFRGRPVVLYFSAAWCPSCIPETEALAQIKSEYGDKVEIIWIDVDLKRDSEADLRRLGKEHGGDFIYAFDRPDNEIALQFKVRALGTTYILDGRGIIRYTDFGPTGYRTYTRELDKILGG